MPNIANMTLTETMEQHNGLEDLVHSFNCDGKLFISDVYNLHNMDLAI